MGKKKGGKEKKAKKDAGPPPPPPEEVVEAMLKSYRAACAAQRIEPCDQVVKSARNQIEGLVRGHDTEEPTAGANGPFLGADLVVTTTELLCANEEGVRPEFRGKGGMEMGPLEATVLCESYLTGAKHISTVAFCGCPVGDQGAFALSNAVKANGGGVKLVAMMNSSLSEHGAASLGKMLVGNVGVSLLRLDHNEGIGDNGAARLTAGLALNFGLRGLCLKYCGIGAEGARALARDVVAKSKVVELSLDGNPLGADGVSALGMALCQSKHLKKLSLSNTDFHDDEDAIDALCTGLKWCASISQLDIRANEIGDEGAEALAAALAKEAAPEEIVIDDASPDCHPLVKEGLVPPAVAALATKEDPGALKAWATMRTTMPAYMLEGRAKWSSSKLDLKFTNLTLDKEVAAKLTSAAGESAGGGKKKGGKKGGKKKKK